jgi:hypothetical protein
LLDEALIAAPKKQSYTRSSAPPFVRIEKMISVWRLRRAHTIVLEAT